MPHTPLRVLKSEQNKPMLEDQLYQVFQEPSEESSSDVENDVTNDIVDVVDNEVNDDEVKLGLDDDDSSLTSTNRDCFNMRETETHDSDFDTHQNECNNVHNIEMNAL